MKTEQLIETYRSKINLELERFFDREVKEANYISSDLSKLLENAKEYTMRGGKRLRAILVIVGYQTTGGKDFTSIVKVAPFIELLQNWFLIHDDICDKATERRGGPAFHIVSSKFGRKHPRVTDANKVGENIAIIVGDIMEAYALRLLSRSNFAEPMKNRVIMEYSEAVLKTGMGELLDILSENTSPTSITEEDILKIHQYKTAYYSVAFPLVCGAIFSGAPDKIITLMHNFGINIGIAFQIIDDIIGAGLSDDIRVGKSENDIVMGKKTLLILKAWERATPKERDKITQTLGNRNANISDIEEVKRIIKSTGSYNYSQDYAYTLLIKASKIIENSNLGDEKKELLINMGQYLVERRY